MIYAMNVQFVTNFCVFCSIYIGVTGQEGVMPGKKHLAAHFT